MYVHVTYFVILHSTRRRVKSGISEHRCAPIRRDNDDMTAPPKCLTGDSAAINDFIDKFDVSTRSARTPWDLHARSYSNRPDLPARLRWRVPPVMSLCRVRLTRGRRPVVRQSCV